jgi:hypothetical protein
MYNLGLRPCHVHQLDVGFFAKLPRRWGSPTPASAEAVDEESGAHPSPTAEMPGISSVDKNKKMMALGARAPFSHTENLLVLRISVEMRFQPGALLLLQTFDKFLQKPQSLFFISIHYSRLHLEKLFIGDL